MQIVYCFRLQAELVKAGDDREYRNKYYHCKDHAEENIQE